MQHISQQLSIISNIASSIRKLQAENGYSHKQIDQYLIKVVQQSHQQNNSSIKSQISCQSLFGIDGEERQFTDIIESLEIELSILQRACLDTEQQLKSVDSNHQPQKPNTLITDVLPFFQRQKIKLSSKEIYLPLQERKSILQNHYDSDEQDFLDQLQENNEDESLDRCIQNTIEQSQKLRKYLLSKMKYTDKATNPFKRKEEFNVLAKIDKFGRDPLNFYDNLGDEKLEMVHEIE